MRHIRRYNEEISHTPTGRKYSIFESITSRSIQTVNFSDLTKNKDYSMIDKYGLWDVGYNLIPNRKEGSVDLVVSVKKFISEFKDYMDELDFGNDKRKIQMEFKLLKKELSNVDYIFLT